MEMEYKNKYELELQIKSQELKTLKENVIKYENNIRDLKDSINRKREIIENKKQMNINIATIMLGNNWQRIAYYHKNVGQ